MEHKREEVNHEDRTPPRLPRIVMPPYEPRTPEEIARGIELSKRIVDRRDKLGIICHDVTELIDGDRYPEQMNERDSPLHP